MSPRSQEVSNIRHGENRTRDDRATQREQNVEGSGLVGTVMDFGSVRQLPSEFGVSHQEGTLGSVFKGARVTETADARLPHRQTITIV
jgi:hypothetical protein